MKQSSLVLNARKELEWKQNLLQPIKQDELLIETIAGAISIGAELPQYNESDVTDSEPKYPRETGYESIGRVLEVGSNVSNVKVGDKVLAFYGHKNYGIVKSEKVVVVPEGIDYTYALLNTLSCDAAKGVLKLDPNPLSKVLVTGAGTMGVLAIHFLKKYLNVKHVDVLEPNESRHKLPTIIGARKIYTTKNQIDQSYYDYGLECSSSGEAFNVLLKSMKVESEVCILSDGNKDLFYLTEDFYEKELKIVGSSDGWDYKKHSEWFLNEHDNSSYLKNIFEYEVRPLNLISTFEDLDNKLINPLKVLVKYTY